MYLFEYLIYHLRPFRAWAGPYTLPKKLTYNEVLRKLEEAETDRAPTIVETSTME